MEVVESMCFATRVYSDMHASVIDVSSLVLGALLGFVGSLLLEYVRRKQQAKLSTKSILGELRELKARLANVFFVISGRTGLLDRDGITWVKSMLVDYEGPAYVQGTKEGIDKLLVLSDADLKSELSEMVNRKGVTTYARKYSLPLLDSQAGRLPDMDHRFVVKLVDIQTRLSDYNEIVDEQRTFFKMTFETELDTANRDNVRQNLRTAEQDLMISARMLADVINEALSKR